MRGLVVAGVVMWCAARSEAETALDKPAFTATPAELLAAAKAAPAGSHTVVLREDHDVGYDEHGRATVRTRIVFVVLTQEGADDWGQLSTSWRPSLEDKPTMQARVIDPSARVVELDGKAIVERSVEADAQGASRLRELEAPLPSDATC